MRYHLSNEYGEVWNLVSLSQFLCFRVLGVYSNPARFSLSCDHYVTKDVRSNPHLDRLNDMLIRVEQRNALGS